MKQMIHLVGVVLFSAIAWLPSLKGAEEGNLPNEDAVNVVVQLVIFHGAQDVMAELFADPLGPGRTFEVSDNLLRKIREMEIKKRITILARPQIAAQSGTEAMLRSVRELIYPTEYEIAVPDKVDPDQKGDGSVLCVPASFRTCEFGILLSVTPVVDLARNTIHVTVFPDALKTIEYKDHRVRRVEQRVTKSDDGETLVVDLTPKLDLLPPVTVEQPEFASGDLSTTVAVANGRPIILAASEPPAEQKTIPQDHMVVFMLTATASLPGDAR